VGASGSALRGQHNAMQRSTPHELQSSAMLFAIPTRRISGALAAYRCARRFYRDGTRIAPSASRR